MNDYFLIGEHLAHSVSPAVHKRLGNPDYRLLELAPDALADFFAKREFAGVNVTIPYKETAAGFCDVLDGRAAKIGAVNTILNMNGVLYGTNTDIDGFIYLCNRARIDLAGKNVVILGSGGTSRTAAAAAGERGAQKITVVSRTGEVNYENVYNVCADADILVNTTPVGMYPDNGGCPVELSRFPRLCGVVDVIYNPLRTRLALEAKARGIPAMGGLPMLVAQAAFADRVFRGVIHSGARIETVIEKTRREMSNLVLIGMPGSGKSTVGKITARITGRRLFDIDREIVSKTGKTIPELFETVGEGGFRQIESEVAREVAKETGAIIACGGGTVLREENRTALAGNGVIVYIRRATENLARRGRPLSAGDGAVERLYEERHEIYEDFADYIIEESETVRQSAGKALAAFSGKESRK